jgi:hypothetical protein
MHVYQSGQDRCTTEMGCASVAVVGVISHGIRGADKYNAILLHDYRAVLDRWRSDWKDEVSEICTVLVARHLASDLTGMLIAASIERLYD